MNQLEQTDAEKLKDLGYRLAATTAILDKLQIATEYTDRLTPQMLQALTLMEACMSYQDAPSREAILNFEINDAKTKPVEIGGRQVYYRLRR